MFRGRVIFTAKCHGSTERVVLPEDLAGKPIDFGAAFAHEARQLPAAAPR